MRGRAGAAAQVRGSLKRVTSPADRGFLKALLAGKCCQCAWEWDLVLVLS